MSEEGRRGEWETYVDGGEESVLHGLRVLRHGSMERCPEVIQRAREIGIGKLRYSRQRTK